MKQRTPILVATLALAIFAVVAPSLCESGPVSDAPRTDKLCPQAIAVFLTAPTANNLSAIKRESPDECRSNLSDEQLQSLDKLIVDGNPFAANFWQSTCGNWMAVNLRMPLRSSGQFSSNHMREFMTLAATGALTEREVADALKMLPLDLDENFDAQLSELHTRRTAIENLHDAKLRELGKMSIEAINASIAEVDHARAAAEALKARQP
jgi:hypothetical protein